MDLRKKGGRLDFKVTRSLIDISMIFTPISLDNHSVERRDQNRIYQTCRTGLHKEN